MDAAKQLLAESGETPGVARAAAVAGVSRATAYRYFPSQEALELEVADISADVATIEDLLPVFDRGHVAIVMADDKFLGLITRIDLLNYLRRRVQ